MLKRLLLLIAFTICSDVARAQDELYGTWEMVSIKGTNVDGQKFHLDTTTIRETKIITPSHYFLIAMDKENGGWTFNRSYIGTVRLDGNRYFESPLLSSLRIFDNVSTDFRWRVEGDFFIQSGSITRPDGKNIILEEFVFRRSSASASQTGNPLLGTWKVINENHEGYLVITPSHWMHIHHENGRFEKANGGTYTRQDQIAVLAHLFGTSPQKTAQLSLKDDMLQFEGLQYRRINGSPSGH